MWLAGFRFFQLQDVLTLSTFSATAGSPLDFQAATDGVFMPAAAGAGCAAPPVFLPARPITQADLAAVTQRVRRRMICWFRYHGVFAPNHPLRPASWTVKTWALERTQRYGSKHLDERSREIDLAEVTEDGRTVTLHGTIH